MVHRLPKLRHEFTINWMSSIIAVGLALLLLFFLWPAERKKQWELAS